MSHYCSTFARRLKNQRTVSNFNQKLGGKKRISEDDNNSTHGEEVYTCEHITTANIFRGIMSQSFHTSTQDGQPRGEEVEEEEEAALFLPSTAPRRGADGARDWKRRLESDNPGLMASCAGSAA